MSSPLTYSLHFPSACYHTNLAPPLSHSSTYTPLIYIIITYVILLISSLTLHHLNHTLSICLISSHLYQLGYIISVISSYSLGTPCCHGYLYIDHTFSSTLVITIFSSYSCEHIPHPQAPNKNIPITNLIISDVTQWSKSMQPTPTITHVVALSG
jgi:hypothetical protein